MLDLWISWMIWLIQEVDRILIRLSLMVMGPPGWGIWLCWTPRYIYIYMYVPIYGDFVTFNLSFFFCPNFDILLRIKGRTVLFVRFDQLLKRKKTMHTKSSPEYICMINDSEIYNELLNDSMKHYSINILFVICISRKKHFSPYNMFMYQLCTSNALRIASVL